MPQALLQTVRHEWPQAEFDGLPELTPSLRWDEALPLYIAGIATHPPTWAPQARTDRANTLATVG